MKGPNAFRVAAMMEVLGWQVDFVELGGTYDFEIRGDEEEPDEVALGFYRKAIEALERFDNLVSYYDRGQK